MYELYREEMRVKGIVTKNIITKSKLPGADYVINPYVGCMHSCIYCYASFMKRFYSIDEDWGKFVYEKNFPQIKNLDKYEGKKILLSSVTDPYQPIENKKNITRNIILSFCDSGVELEILTKSKLVLRDIKLLKRIPKLLVGVSVSIDKEIICKKVERGCSSYRERVDVLKKLSLNNIKTYAFISPIFPYITDYKKIIKELKGTVNYFYFENLNLRSNYKKGVFNFIRKNYSEYYEEYLKIYNNRNYYKKYWERIKEDIIKIAVEENISDKIKLFFFHNN